jgi:hypothetical protein
MGKVLSAQGSGYFPTCIVSDPDYVGQVTGSLQDIMSLYWRVKNFKVSVSGSGIFDLGDNPISCSFSGETGLQTIYRNAFDPQPSITDEASLVCGYNIRSHEHLEGSGMSFILGGGEFGPAFMQMYFETVFSRPSESTYVIRFRFRLFETTLNVLSITGNPSSQGDSNAVGSWSISLFGTNIIGTAYSQSIASGSFNVNFTATEYWSYGGTYNTTTGEPL